MKYVHFCLNITHNICLSLYCHDQFININNNLQEINKLKAKQMEFVIKAMERNNINTTNIIYTQYPSNYGMKTVCFVFDVII